MEKDLSKDEVKAELADHSENMSRRIEGIEEEMTSTFSDAMQWLQERPLVSLGGALFLGLVVGSFVKSRRSRADELTRLQERLVGYYLEAMDDRIERSMKEGLSRREAMHQALEDGVPLIIYESRPEYEQDAGGGMLSTMIKTSFGFLLREVADELVDNLVAGIGRRPSAGPAAGSETREAEQ